MFVYGVRQWTPANGEVLFAVNSGQSNGRLRAMLDGCYSPKADGRQSSYRRTFFLMSDISPIIEPNVKAGEKIEFNTDTPLGAMVSWAAPVTTGHEIVVPSGTRATVTGDSVPSAEAFVCVPDNYDEFGATHIPEHESRPEGYSGYCLVVMKAALGDSVSLLPRN